MEQSVQGPFGSQPKGRAFPQTFSQKTLGSCPVRAGSLVENSETRTTFLVRCLKSQNEPPLTN